jgi:hypothetical protein
VIETPREESDQLPEEQPAEAVPDDTGGSERDEANGNPDAAGSDE